METLIEQLQQLVQQSNTGEASVGEVKVKAKKERKPYVATEKRKLAFHGLQEKRRAKLLETKYEPFVAEHGLEALRYKYPKEYARRQITVTVTEGKPKKEKKEKKIKRTEWIASEP